MLTDDKNLKRLQEEGKNAGVIEPKELVEPRA
jgi:hypothetical protein